MALFSVELLDRSGDPAVVTGLTLAPVRWSARSMGGPYECDVEGTGGRDLLWAALRMLGYGLNIRNEQGRLCWWGYVHEAQVTAGGVTVGLSLDEMHNRVRVLYAWDDENGEPADGETTAVNDSVTQALYGLKDLLYSAGECDPDAAAALAAKILATQGKPRATARPVGMDEPDGLRLRGKGHWQRLGWQYYADATGKLTFETSGAEQAIGWSYTGADVAFTDANKRIHTRGVPLQGLRQGDRIEVSGAAESGNNQMVTVANTARETAPKSYTAATISFDAQDDILDTAGGLGDFQIDDVVLISGSTDNSGYHLLDEQGASHITTKTNFGGDIVSEAAGPSITIEQLLSVQVSETVTREVAGSTVTLLLHGGKVAQSFTPGGTWTLHEARLLLRKEGGPSDNVVLKIFSNSAGLPDAEVGAATAVAGADIGTAQRWVSFEFATPVSLTSGTYYWIVLTRSGTASSTNYFLVGVDEGLNDSSGAFKVWTGAAWAEREPNADMAYQLWGKRETTTQIVSMLTGCAWVEGVSVRQASGLNTTHYRDGRQTVQDEVEDLLTIGTSAGAPLWARVTPERTVVIEGEPAADVSSDLLIDGAGLHAADGTLLSAGLVPAGRWAWLRDLPPGVTAAGLAPLWLEVVEYDVRRAGGPGGNGWEWEPRGAPDPIAQWRLRQG